MTTSAFKTYTQENGGRVLLLFLLFLLSLYSLKTSGIGGMAMVSVMPAIVIFIYLAFRFRLFTFWVLFIENFLIMFISTQGYLPSGIPASLYNEMFEIVLIGIAVIDLRESHFENLGSMMLVGVGAWCAFCTLEIFNDSCGLGINIGAWFQGVRLMAFQLLYAVVVCNLYITEPKQIYHFFYLWAFMCFFAAFWSWKQQHFGFTAGEKTWLVRNARTHIISSGIRYWSIFSDAANFGIHMASAAIAFLVIAISNRVRKYKIFFAIAFLISIWTMFSSGTRTAMFCFIAGVLAYLVLSKSVKIMVPVSIFLAVMVFILAFTKIGQSNAQIRRMRTAFDSSDASANVRDINKAAIKKYMKDAPWGIGIGIFSENIPAWNKFKIVSSIPPDSEYVFIWVRTGKIGLTVFALVNLFVLFGACWTVLFKIKNKSLAGIGAAWCCAFVSIQLGAYANQILMQFPNVLMFYGGLAIVYNLPGLESAFEAYEAKELEKQAERDRLKLEKKRASRV